MCVTRFRWMRMNTQGWWIKGDISTTGIRELVSGGAFVMFS